jgi:pyridoxine 4-dehydrogenase
VIRHIGLSNVSVDQFSAARRIAGIAAVTAHFNVVNRGNAELLRAAEEAGAAFSPWQPVSLVPPRPEPGRPGHRPGPDEVAAIDRLG